jgi:hypothetical protein
MAWEIAKGILLVLAILAGGWIALAIAVNVICAFLRSLK